MSIFNLSEEDFLSVVTPIAESMQVGWDEDSYEKFSEYFSESMKEYVDIENYSKQRKVIFSDLGKHKKMELLATHKNPNEIIVMWRLYCSNREAPALTTYFFQEKNGKVVIEAANINY
jgi:hypothetical protein